MKAIFFLQQHYVYHFCRCEILCEDSTEQKQIMQIKFA